MHIISSKYGKIIVDKDSLDVLRQQIQSITDPESAIKTPRMTALQAKLDALAKLIPEHAFENLLSWTMYTRPVVAGRPNYLKYVQFWHDIYKDDHKWIQLLLARQMWKSNYLAARLGRKMTQYPGSHVLYGTYEDESLTVFSSKFRFELFNASSILRQFLKGSTIGSVTRLELLTDSVAWLVTHAHSFTHVEGKSTIDQAWDEAQYIDWENFLKAREAQSFTNGDFVAVGIGGEEDTPYHVMWKSTDQREWIPANDDVYIDTAGKEFPGQGWRKKLQFDDKGLVWGDYMIKDGVTDGNWQITRPDNSDRHGYHISQLMAPWIALSKSDAVKLYKKLPEDSLEGKQTDPNTSYNDYVKHALAGWTKGDIKPFPRDLLYKLIDKRLSFQRPDQVDYSLGDLYLGADWGGGNRSVKWIYQVTNEQIPVFRLINAKRIETKDVNKQFLDVSEWMDDYSIKQAVVDGGGGTHQVQELERRYGERCKKFFYLKRPGEPTAKNSAEERDWNSKNMWQYDKTWLMDRVKDLMSRPHMEGTQLINKIVLPGADMEKLEWIFDQFGNETTEKIKMSTGEYYTRYFTPDKDKKPDDALQAQNFAIVAWDLGRSKGSGRAIAQIDDTPSTDYSFGNSY
jgi:hypothetical protein